MHAVGETRDLNYSDLIPTVLVFSLSKDIRTDFMWHKDFL